MDSLIRLDALMPIAPLTENNINIHSPINDNVVNSNQQQTADGSSIISLEDEPDLIDLTTPQGDRVQPNLAKDMVTRPIPITYPPVVITDEDGGVAGTNHRSPTKHKLSPLINHSPSKVSRTDFYHPFFDTVDSNENRQSSFRPTYNQERSGPIIPPPIMKNHTVTSSNGGVQVGLGLDLCVAGTSGEINSFGPYSNRHNALTNAAGPSLVDKDKGPNNILNITFPQNFHQGNMEEKHIQTEFQQQKSVQINRGLWESKAEEATMFFQLLDMFPDIDLKFLENQCNLGLDINQVSDIILGMKDYPKYDFKNSNKPILTSKVVVNVNLNNLNIPPSCSSSTAQILADEVQLVPEENMNRVVLSPATTPPVVLARHNLICDPTSQISGNGKSNHESSCTSSNSQNTSRPKHTKNEIVGKEKNSLLYKNDDTKSVQSQFCFLMEIFPDADPTFMEIKSKLTDNDLRNFIAECMEKHDYPKITASVKNENEVGDETIEIGLYTTNFNLEDFLNIFPDPFGYFLDEKRNCQYTEHGFGFLKRRYRCHSIKQILLKYKEFKHNLVKTCEFFDIEKPSRVTKRGLTEIKMPEETNLPFLQEACFIEHKTEIKKFLDDVAEAKTLAYDQAEARGELIECGCCYQNILFEDCATCNEGHLFCKSCVQKSVEVRIGDGHTTFPCLQECDAMFSLRLLEGLVNATMFSRLLQRIQLDEVRAADIEGLEVCPFCDFAIILPPETSIFKCLNPECLKESCRKCHRLSHIPQRCEELESDDQARARKYIEDEMTRALVRVCYKCKKSFIKTDGCNKMTCTCGAKMCYICREPIIDYKHFNGPGGEEKQKCPLYSTDKLLHVDAVEAVAKKALEEVTSKNPELKLKHDPSKLLPNASAAKTSLPPGVMEQAERLIVVLQNIRQQTVQVQLDRQCVNHNMLPQHVPPRIVRPHRHNIRPAANVNIQAGAHQQPQDQQNLGGAAGLVNRPIAEDHNHHRAGPSHHTH